MKETWSWSEPVVTKETQGWAEPAATKETWGQAELETMKETLALGLRWALALGPQWALALALGSRWAYGDVGWVPVLGQQGKDIDNRYAYSRQECLAAK